MGRGVLAVFPLLAILEVPMTYLPRLVVLALALGLGARASHAQCDAVQLSASNAKAGDSFGQDVAADGRTLMVGAPRAAVANPGIGSVYVFERDADGWSESQILQPTPGEGGAFGESVDVVRQVAVVGAPSHPGGGAAYVYENAGDGSGWSLVQKLVGSDTASGHQFGADVAVFGGVIVVGASQALSPNVGQGYVFERVADVWTEVAVVPHGYFVAASEERILVGSRLQGVRIYEKLAGTWTLVDSLDDSGWILGDAALSKVGDVVVLGGQEEAYVLEHSDGLGWGPATTLYAPVFFSGKQVAVAMRDDGSGVYVGKTSLILASDNQILGFERTAGGWAPGVEYAGGLLTYGTTVAWASGSVIGGAPHAPVGGGSGRVLVNEDPFETFGVAKPGFAGIEPILGFSGCPVPGGDIDAFMFLGLGGASGLLLVGLNKDEVLIDDLTLWTSNLVTTLPVQLGGTPGFPALGSAEIRLSIPPVQNLQGLSAILQGVILDPNVSSGYSSTAGYRMWIR